MLRLICASILLSICLMSVSAQEHEDASPQAASQEHSIELSELIIDDFSNFSDRFLPYSEASYNDVLRARNRIRPFCRAVITACFAPEYEAFADAEEWLHADDLLIGYIAADGTAYAFPEMLLTFHEIVNDELGGVPILVSYSPHSRSAAVYSRMVNGTSLDFGNTSIYYQNLSTIYDAQSESLWLSANGRAIVGENTDNQLERLPSIVTTWHEWASLHPDTLVLSRRPNYVNYEQDLFSDYETRLNLGRFVFPVSELVLDDTRLDYAEQVLLLEGSGEVKAYPIESLVGQLVIDSLGGENILVLGHSADGTAVATAFQLQLEDGTVMPMAFEKVGESWLELNSQSMLDDQGYFTDGELDGHRLLPVPTAYMYWFAAVAAYPQVELFQAAPN
jgi:hypothetical protein